MWHKGGRSRSDLDTVVRRVVRVDDKKVMTVLWIGCVQPGCKLSIF
jgi:hypothetical protein